MAYMVRFLYRKPNGFLLKDYAYSVLSNYGYDFKYLYSMCPPLKAETVDLSIIVPVYNGEKYLNKCLTSIFCQHTNYTYEVICINDGSKDSSLLILNHFQQKNSNMIIYCQDNAGISAARNKGIELANGKYLAFVDNDDTISQNFVQICLDLAYANNADMVQSAYSNVTPNDIVKSIDSKGNFIINKYDDFRRVTSVKGFIWGGISKKELYKDIRFPLYFWYEDMFTRMLLMRKSKVIVSTEKSLYNYLRIPTSASSTLWNSANIKCIDQLWLPILFSEYAKENLGINPDSILYGILLKEWALLLNLRTKGLPEEIRQAAFSIACDYLSTFECKFTHPQKLYNIVNYAMHTRNYKLWKYASLALKY